MVPASQLATMLNQQHDRELVLSTFRRIGLAFNPTAQWCALHLYDVDEVCAEIDDDDQRLTIFHPNGSRSHYALDQGGNPYCCSVFLG